MKTENEVLKGLASKIVPNKKYPVFYTIKQDGTRVEENAWIYGSDLTENQIRDLYYSGFFKQYINYGNK